MDRITLQLVHAPGSPSWNGTVTAMNIMDVLVTALLSYGLGCISFAYYFVRIFAGKDIRELGSGNAGARNVARVFGRPAGFAVMAGDIAKGALAVWLAAAISPNVHGELLAMTLVVVGHNWPLQLGFRGGKGLAAGFGALVMVMPMVALAATVINATFSLILHSAIAGTLLAAAITPILAISLGQDGGAAALLFLPIGIILLSHRGYISKMVSGRKTGQ